MTAASPSPAAGSLARVLRLGATAADALAKPQILLRLRQAALFLMGLWILLSLWRGILSFIPEAPALPPTQVINPMVSAPAADVAVAVDIDTLSRSPLFGVPVAGAASDLAAAGSGRTPTMSEEEAAQALAGIEDGAPATRLPLRLRGVVASSEAGLGQAIIEYQNRQDLYQVGDDLPVNGNVVLAKVLPELVVLDNTGRYEVLKLFEESGLVRQATAGSQQASRVDTAPRAGAAPRPAAVPGSTSDTAQIASRYREQLYENPESLADVVLVSAVRDGSTLRGYRVMPGKASDEFRALGFEAGDIVTAVNGLSLSEPANTMRLYQAMRSATSASFELERNGEPLTLDVSLNSTGSGS